MLSTCAKVMGSFFVSKRLVDLSATMSKHSRWTEHSRWIWWCCWCLGCCWGVDSWRCWSFDWSVDWGWSFVCNRYKLGSWFLTFIVDHCFFPFTCRLILEFLGEIGVVWRHKRVWSGSLPSWFALTRGCFTVCTCLSLKPFWLGEDGGRSECHA